jgi:hypothetical protein
MGYQEQQYGYQKPYQNQYQGSSSQTYQRMAEGHQNWGQGYGVENNFQRHQDKPVMDIPQKPELSDYTYEFNPNQPNQYNNQSFENSGKKFNKNLSRK